ncbi:hypothetical protein C8A05DRAFT_41763 [Staphylotrichum tortipilum]|uniref:Uncharacterized protein n=1 Tax=Staphylotrichum tortipilum TaxID=2831512 RepID=A0AAN6RX11_9PEZI|nr:hypothetical protein C8A05DRAFT_41763 [Staphylotrichum longicolle]
MPKPAILVLAPPDSLTTRLLHLLTSSSPFSGHPILITSLTTSPSPSLTSNPNLHPIPFSWPDSGTWSKPFEFPLSPPPSQGGDNNNNNKTASSSGRGGSKTEIGAVYIAPPPAGGEGTANPAELVEDFVGFAKKRGVKRFVVLRADGPVRGMGSVERWLRELGRDEKEVEWAVLRAGWVQQNFVDQPVQLQGIRDDSKIYSAAGQGRVAWVSADDVAAIAVRALTDREPPNTVYTILGPELLTYNQIAAILTETLGRQIVHTIVSPAELQRRHECNVPRTHAATLVAMDTSVKVGVREQTNDVVLALTGHAPKPFREFARSAKELWEKPGDGRLAAVWEV